MSEIHVVQDSDSPVSIDTPEVATQIAEYRPIAAALHDLYTRHAGVIHDCTTTQGMRECRAARAEIRTCRTSLEAKRKEIKAPALERCRLIDADANRITDALLAIEGPLDQQVKAEEDAAEARREAKRKADAERLAVNRQILNRIRAFPIGFFAASAEELRRGIEECANRPIGEMPEEIQEEGAAANAEAMDKLREMLAARETKDAEDVRLAAERAERERLQAAERTRQEAENAAREREVAAERERQAAEAQRLREERQRIAAERATMERELDEERARIKGMDGGPAPHPAPDTWIEVADVFPGSEPSEGAEPTQAEPSDAVVLRDLAHVLERGGEPYDWIPNRLRMIADRLQDLESDPVGARSSESPW